MSARPQQPGLSIATPVLRSMRPLSIDECLEILATQQVGRLGFIDDGRAEIRPMTYILDQGSIIVRLNYGRVLDAIIRNAVVFEVEDLSEARPEGASVIIHGRADEVWKPAELDVLRRLPLRPWAPGPRVHYVRIAPASITGRAIS